MNRNLDDPRLTAYALGEMDETERAAFEMELNNWKEGRQAVDEIRAAAAWLSSELAKDAPLELAPSQRQAIETKAAQPLSVPRKRGHVLPVPRWMEYAVAAMLVIGVSSVALVQWREAQVRAKVATANAAMRNGPTSSGTTYIDYNQYDELVKQQNRMQVAKVDPGQNPVIVGYKGINNANPNDWSGVTASVSHGIANEAGVQKFDVDGNLGAPVVQTSSLPDDPFKSNNQTPASDPSLYMSRYDKTQLHGGIVVSNGPDQSSQHILRKGESLDSIAAKYGVTVEDLKRTYNFEKDTNLTWSTTAGALAQLNQGVPHGPKNLTAEQMRQMKSLGYVAGGNGIDNEGDGNTDENYVWTDGNDMAWQWPYPAAESYEPITDNAFTATAKDPMSTFSIDVDTAAYSNVRRYLNGGAFPPKDAVRIEELINYFDYDYAPPTDEHPFASHIETAACPWKPEHRLVRIALKGRIIEETQRPPCNLVFLLDVSGSMSSENKLPLVKQSMRLLLEKLAPADRVAIVTYAGESGVALASTSCDQKDTIAAAIDALHSGGSTNGASGINLAYETAANNFIPDGANRVILCTDGDFNVGVTSQQELQTLIEEKAKTGVFLSILGFGMGNLKDSTLEMLADKGNGNYGYIDTLNEAVKVFCDQLSSTLVTIAKDVKIQIRFNPTKVGAFRLIGYENRILAHEDFNDDTKDAGEIGASHAVTALYEIVPAGAEMPYIVHEVKPTDSLFNLALKYKASVTEIRELNNMQTDALTPGSKLLIPAVNPQEAGVPVSATETIAPEDGTTPASGDSLLTLSLRYKKPDEDTSHLMVSIVRDEGKAFEQSSADFKFAAAVAEFGMVLRDSPYRGTSNFDETLKLAQENTGADKNGYRAEFVELIGKAKSLTAATTR